MRRVTLALLPLVGMLLAAGVASAHPALDPDKTTSARLTQASTEAGFPSKLIAKP